MEETEEILNSNIKVLPVILSGGKGTRLWPLSRKSFPKQFLAIGNDNKKSLQSFWEPLSLGIECSFPISAFHGLGIEDLKKGISFFLNSTLIFVISLLASTNPSSIAKGPRADSIFPHVGA